MTACWLPMVAAVALCAPAACGAAAPRELFAMDTCTQRTYPVSDIPPGAQLDMVRDLGYRGIAWTVGDPAELRTVVAGAKQRRLRLNALYASATLTRGGLRWDPRVPDALEAIAGTGAVLWLHVGSSDFAHSSPEGDETAARGLRELAELASRHRVRIALYPHVGEWIERVQDAVRVADRVNRRDVGVTFNLCHCLQLGDEKRIPDLLRAAGPRLMVVTISGADTGAAGAGWDRLIQPLDRGTFDLRGLLRELDRIGYRGPIGLQGFGWQGDRRELLERSMAAWRRLASPAAR